MFGARLLWHQNSRGSSEYSNLIQWVDDSHGYYAQNMYSRYMSVGFGPTSGEALSHALFGFSFRGDHSHAYRQVYLYTRTHKLVCTLNECRGARERTDGGLVEVNICSSGAVWLVKSDGYGNTVLRENEVTDPLAVLYNVTYNRSAKLRFRAGVDVQLVFFIMMYAVDWEVCEPAHA